MVASHFYRRPSSVHQATLLRLAAREVGTPLTLLEGQDIGGLNFMTGDADVAGLRAHPSGHVCDSRCAALVESGGAIRGCR